MELFTGIIIGFISTLFGTFLAELRLNYIRNKHQYSIEMLSLIDEVSSILYEGLTQSHSVKNVPAFTNKYIVALTPHLNQLEIYEVLLYKGETLTPIRDFRDNYMFDYIEKLHSTEMNNTYCFKSSNEDYLLNFDEILMEFSKYYINYRKLLLKNLKL